MLTIILSWLFLFIVIYFVGRFSFNSKVLGFLRFKVAPEWYEYFWVGFAVVVTILQIWSLFLPVNVYSFIFVSFPAVISIFIFARKKVKIPKINYLFISLSLIILLAISYFASLSGGWPDTYGYHITSVKWANLGKIVPGLANLYTRLGFNSSSFLYEAMVNNLYLKDRASHVALSLLASVLSIEFLWIFLKSRNNYLKTFMLLSLPIFIEAIIRSVQVSSFSYDFALQIIILAICIELIKWNKSSIHISAILAFLLVTIKLSGAMFSLIIICFTLYGLFWKKRNRRRGILFLGLVGAVIITPYIIRNIILSGWPFYPLPILKFNLPWTVPTSGVVDLFNVIRGWAIAGTGWRTVIDQNFLQWFPGWYSRNSGHIEVKIFVLSVILFISLLLLKRLNKQVVIKNIGLTSCAAASFASILYLVFSAPDFRFGAIYFWAFFAAVGSLFFVQIIRKKLMLLNLMIALSLFLTFKISWPPRTDSEIILRSLRWDQPGTTDEVLITPVDGSAAFKVNVARDDSFCGNANLPCTSEVSNHFKEIKPGNVFGGYAPVK